MPSVAGPSVAAAILQYPPVVHNHTTSITTRALGMKAPVQRCLEPATRIAVCFIDEVDVVARERLNSSLTITCVTVHPRKLLVRRPTNVHHEVITS